MSEESQSSEAPQKPDQGTSPRQQQSGESRKEVVSKQPQRKPTKQKDKAPGEKQADGQSAKDRAVDGKGSGADADATKDSAAGSQGRHRRSRGGGREGGSSDKPASKHDPALLAQHAWKIYLGEIKEEGVTLIDDQAARALAIRCFELAAFFLDEQKRRSKD